MRKFLACMMLFLLSGCQQTETHTIIDWVDFIKWDGKSYQGIYTGAIADPALVGEEKGTVQFKVADVVTDTSYRTKDGDAAFHEIGTAFYEVEGEPELLAVEDKEAINGYRIYVSDDEPFRWNFEDVPLAKVSRVEIYQLYTESGLRKVNEWTDANEIQQFIGLLTSSTVDNQFVPDTTTKDPTYYDFVLYTGEPIAYRFGLQFDGTTYYWFPDETEILSDDVASFLKGEIE